MSPERPALLIGVDAGGSHTAVAIADGNLNIFARAEGPGAAMRPEGGSRSAAVIAELVREAAGRAGEVPPRGGLRGAGARGGGRLLGGARRARGGGRGSRRGGGGIAPAGGVARPSRLSGFRRLGAGGGDRHTGPGRRRRAARAER